MPGCCNSAYFLFIPSSMRAAYLLISNKNYYNIFFSSSFRVLFLYIFFFLWTMLGKSIQSPTFLHTMCVVCCVSARWTVLIVLRSWKNISYTAFWTTHTHTHTHNSVDCCCASCAKNLGASSYRRSTNNNGNPSSTAILFSLSLSSSLPLLSSPSPLNALDIYFFDTRCPALSLYFCVCHKTSDRLLPVHRISFLTLSPHLCQRSSGLVWHRYR